MFRRNAGIELVHEFFQWRFFDADTNHRANFNCDAYSDRISGGRGNAGTCRQEKGKAGAGRVGERCHRRERGCECIRRRSAGLEASGECRQPDRRIGTIKRRRKPREQSGGGCRSRPRGSYRKSRNPRLKSLTVDGRSHWWIGRKNNSQRQHARAGTARTVGRLQLCESSKTDSGRRPDGAKNRS